MQAVRAGAFDYISKPFNIAEVKGAVERALAAGWPRRRPPSADAGAATGRTARPHVRRCSPFTSKSRHAADSIAPVLVSGESGTGKELFARAIHAHGERARRPFVAGQLRRRRRDAARVRAVRPRPRRVHRRDGRSQGSFEPAHGGTVFLDEIGDTPPAMQVKLLRVLGSGEVRPVGASRTIHVDARVVAATNVDIERTVAEERFREDLYYRLSVIVIRLPPLRERREDIPLLINQFVGKASARAGRQVTLSPDTIAALTAYRWPGNVRELENTIERLVVFSRGRMKSQDLPGTIVAAPPLQERLFQGLPALEELERRYLLHVLEAVGGNRSRAAEVLGVDRRTLYRMVEQFGITLSDENEKAN